MLNIGHDKNEIQSPKKVLSKSFAMKVLDFAKEILGMRIVHDTKNGKL